MTASTQLVKIHENLGKLLKDKAAALPRNFNQTRFLQNAMTVLQDTKNIEKMNPVSVARTMLKGAFLGLDFFAKECYAIPYGNDLQFQTDYKGEIKLAKMYSIKKISDIYAKLVRKGDEFVEKVINGQPCIDFTPRPFNQQEVIGVFAVCRYVDGTMIYETMTLQDVEDVRRKYSRMADGKAWKDSHGEMMKKTCLRRLCKLIEHEFTSAEQDEAYEEGSDAVFKEADYEIVNQPPIEDPVEVEDETLAEMKADLEAPDEDQGETEVAEDQTGNQVTSAGITYLRQLLKDAGIAPAEVAKFTLHHADVGVLSVNDMTREQFDKIEAAAKKIIASKKK